ncbi:MAG: transporter [Desulfuromonadales bacterium]
MSKIGVVCKLFFGFIVFCLLQICYVQPGLATEGGGGAYPNGAEDFMAGAVPPPGTYLVNYFTYYSADRLNDKSGDSSVPGFKLNVTGNVMRMIHVTNKTLLGASWAMHAFVPIINVDVTTPAGNNDKLGFGDIIIDPIILAWHSKNLHVAAGVDVFIPTGAYNSTRMANVGRNYWTFEPVVGVTYLSDNGIDLSLKLMYDINTINTATDYTSGNEFHMDFSVGKKFDALTVGAGGYLYQQVTNDKQHGATISNSKGSAVAIGPQLKYDYKNMSFTLKYIMDVDSSNRPEGNNFWFKTSYAF